MAPNKPKNKSKSNGKSNVELEKADKNTEKTTELKEPVQELPKDAQETEKVEAQEIAKIEVQKVNDLKPGVAKEETIEEIVERVKSNSTQDEKDLKTIGDVLKKLDLDSEDFNAEQKLNALCIIFREVVAVNVRLRDSNSNLTEQVAKTEQTKEALQKLCGALRTQILLTKEEGELKVRDETQRRIEVSENFQKTIEELGTLMSTHFETNSKLKDENVVIGKQMKELLEQFENRQEKFDHLTTEHKLQMELYEAKLNKAKLEKAEMSTDFTRERLELHKSLVEAKNQIDILLTREENLMEQIELYKIQATELQNTLSEMSNAPTSAQTSFAHFRTEIDKLSKRMKMMEKDSAEWKEKFEASNDQVRRMNSLAMEKEKEITLIKKKLAAMENLNRVLSKERNDLLGQMKAENGQKST